MSKVLQKVLFSEEECNKIIQFSNRYSDFIVTPLSSLKQDTRTVYASSEDNSWSKSYNVWDIPLSTDTSWMYGRLYDWFSKETGLPLSRQVDAHKLHQYKVGDKFSKHIDNFGYPDRIWNIGIQLNSNYSGGDYIVYTDSSTTYLSKEVGNVIAYTSDILHEVTEIVEGERWSMVIKVHDWEIIPKQKYTLL